ncbi:MAG: shikimate dehydrogenase [Deltaproteobacteria bacterium]|nr:shikimate dehydrogenase [Deltaproteobacteria bacterium]
MTLDQRHQLAIIGDPVEHSLSPVMHQAAFRKCGLPYTYSKIHLRPNEVKDFFRAIKSSNFLGLNVTIPNKEAVLPFVEELSKEAKMIGAVNTIKICEGRILGFNTDGQGYIEALKREKHFEVKGKKILLFGAGGAARALIAALAFNGVKDIFICNRSKDRAEKLSREFSKKFIKTKILAVEWEEKALAKISPKIDLVIQSTSLGLKGEELPYFPWDKLPSHCLVTDIIYLPTPFLKEAQKRKFKTQNGLGMLLYQGVLAFEIWTGKKAPVLVMKRALKEALRGKNEIADYH